ncbi:TonB-dependent receptor plug domain-containing protein [Kordiimonas marina]|uniref:TonB-dependent receptor plug domain-containing protein n=1 Tax=Kordiimonas marina TaxID=2872312 RepID=UPI001FF2A24B|nr:TonB-dependent receptor [Kordiimonas marina]MCJ9427839.1 TonB-dependent receptor [Kordiimonas marina]
MSPRFTLALLGATALLPASTAFADDTAASLDAPDEIVVTASRRAEKKDDVGASISVVTKEELQRSQAAFVLDAVRSLPGVEISPNGAFGGQATVRIRGASADQSVVLIDGIQVNDTSSPGGSFNFGTLDTNGLQRIEVLKGPQAVLYGSDAIGGVINMISETGGGALSGSVFGEYGAFDTFRGGATVKGGGDRFGFNLSVGGMQTVGISAADAANGNTERDGYDAYGFHGRVTGKISDAVSAEVIAYYNHSYTETDSWGPVDGPDNARSKDYALAGRLHVDLMDGKLENTLSVERSGINRVSDSGGWISEGHGRRTDINYLGVYQLTDTLHLTAGAEREVVAARSVTTGSVGINSLFGVLAYQQKDGLSLSAGVRYDDHETFGGTTNGQFRASYRFAGTGTRVFANWGQGFKAPTLFQLTYICTFCGLSAPSSGLNPERSKAWEAGLEQTLLDERVTLSATYFHQNVTDMIDFSYSAGYVNIASARLRGVELGLAAALTDSLHLDANYTFTSAKDGVTGVQLIRQPRHRVFAAVNWDVTKRFSTRLSVTHTSSIVDSNTLTVDAWTRADLRAAYKLNDHFELYGRIDNLFDAQYEELWGYGTPGRSGYIGIRSKF